MRAIKRYIDEGKITPEDIREKARRILLCKYRLGLFDNATYPSATNLRAELNTDAARQLKKNACSKRR